MLSVMFDVAIKTDFIFTCLNKPTLRTPLSAWLKLIG